MIVTNCLEEYFALMKSRPELFSQSDVFPIVTDTQIIEEYEKSTGKKIGVLYKSKYNMLVADLINANDKFFIYERIIPTATGRGVVCIPVFQGKLLLLNQYRHSIRKQQLCFPRGFGENNITSAENAKKELYEEIGAHINDIKYLGSFTADSGLIGSECDIFLCFIDSYNEISKEEGIEKIFLFDEKTFEDNIKSNNINDGFTLGAYALYKTASSNLL